MDGVNQKVSKQMEGYKNLKKNFMDDLEQMAQESEEILKKVYEATGGKAEIGLGSYGDNPRMGPSEGVLGGKRYEIKFGSDQKIYLKPEMSTQEKTGVVQRTGIAKAILGPEKTVKEKIPTGRVYIEIEPSDEWDPLKPYIEKCKTPSLVEVARKIKEADSVTAAEKFAELNKRIRELPTQLTEHLEARMKEMKAARVFGSVKDIDKLDYIKPECGHCGAPNPNLDPTCGYCGHAAYEIPKKK